MKNIAERTCVICRTKKPKEELFRFVIKDKEVVFDKQQKDSGRGFYLCGKECWENAVKKKRKIKISSRENKFVTVPDIGFEEITKR